MMARSFSSRARLVTICAMLGTPSSASAQSAAPIGSDTYSFTPAAGDERKVTLSPAEGGLRLTWPGARAGPSTGLRAGWDTALLGVWVNANGADPLVAISAGAVRLEQHLDPGGSGLRWLNLTGLRGELKDGTAVTLTGEGVVLEPGDAILRLFTNKLDLTGRILILAPHPDDAEIAAFGLYADRNATIVTVTSGNAGDANYADNVKDPAKQYLLKGYLRAVDSVTVPWQGGIPPSRTANLGYFDARLKTMREKPAEAVPEMYGPNTDVAPYRRANISSLVPNTSRTNTWNHLVEDLVTILKKVNPNVIVMPFPQLDSHADHQHVAVAAVEAFAKWKRTPRFLLFTNHATGTRDRYPYGPAGTVTSVPPYSGPAVSVMSVYAHPVSEEVQLRKLFALESMHDLRLSPAEQNALASGHPNPARRDDYPRQPAVDYLRRAPRPQEIFFVFDRAGVVSTINAFLATQTKD
ncbi:MAG: PIG-L family deacetylase [Acidobacteria bacterium]|nr:PIG-L family deacetylase [Acidobacteriota bacterium]